MSAALDSCAGLIKLVAVLVLNGRDKELEELVGGTPPHNRAEGSGKVNGKGGSDVAGTIRGHLQSGQGIGREAIMAIHRARGTEAKRRVIDEAVASLKASGEHDRIIAEVAAEVEARLENERQDAERREREAAEAARIAEQKRLEVEERRKAAEAERVRRDAEAKARREEADRARAAAAAAKNEADRQRQFLVVCAAPSWPLRAVLHVAGSTVATEALGLLRKRG